MQPAERAVAGPDQAVLPVPGPHGPRGEGRTHRDTRVPVAVQEQEVELLHGRRFQRLRACA